MATSKKIQSPRKDIRTRLGIQAASTPIPAPTPTSPVPELGNYQLTQLVVAKVRVGLPLNPNLIRYLERAVASPDFKEAQLAFRTLWVPLGPIERIHLILKHQHREALTHDPDFPHYIDIVTNSLMQNLQAPGISDLIDQTLQSPIGWRVFNGMVINNPKPDLKTRLLKFVEGLQNPRDVQETVALLFNYWDSQELDKWVLPLYRKFPNEIRPCLNNRLSMLFLDQGETDWVGILFLATQENISQGVLNLIEKTTWIPWETFKDPLPYDESRGENRSNFLEIFRNPPEEFQLGPNHSNLANILYRSIQVLDPKDTERILFWILKAKCANSPYLYHFCLSKLKEDPALMVPRLIDLYRAVETYPNLDPDYLILKDQISKIPRVPCQIKPPQMGVLVRDLQKWKPSTEFGKVIWDIVHESVMAQLDPSLVG